VADLAAIERGAPAAGDHHHLVGQADHDQCLDGDDDGEHHGEEDGTHRHGDGRVHWLGLLSGLASISGLAGITCATPLLVESTITSCPTPSKSSFPSASTA